MKGEYLMFLRFVLLGLLIVFIIFFIDIILPKINFKYKMHKELIKTRKRQKAFKNKMKQLEIK